MHLAALQLPQPRPRAAREGDRRGGEGRARAQRRRARSSSPPSSTPRGATSRGSTRRVIEAYAAEPSRGTLRAVRDRTKERGAGFELRVMASPRRHDLDRRRPAGDARWSPARSAASSAPAGWPTGSASTTCSAPTSAAPRSTSPCSTGKRYEVTTTPDMAKFLLNMPLVQIDSVGAGCGSFVRIDPNARRPEIGPDSAGAIDRHRLARGRRGDRLDHRPQPGARPAQPRLLPRRPGHSSTSSAPATRSSARSRSRSGSASRRRPPA